MEGLLSKWGLPPIEKVHEALSAVADGRVKLFDDHALVSSSDYKKEYTITWDENKYSSNDNASYWQGYLGYPIIAVLMSQGKLRYDATIAAHFKGINWKVLNTKHKNNYAKVVGLILEDMRTTGIDIDAINNEIESIFEQIKSLDIGYKKSKLPPPR